MKKLLLLFNTIKYLRWEQVVYRVYYKFYTPKLKKKAFLESYNSNFCWRDESYRAQSVFSKNRVKFLGKEGRIATTNDWNSEQASKLWLYNLHYFDDLNSEGSVDRCDIHLYLVDKWIDDNPPCHGNGWEPYPLSLRIVNWVKWYSRLSLKNEKILTSLHKQLESLSKQLEFHILGNHLFANAKALVFAGVFFSSEKTDKYLAVGIGILNREIKEQFLSDGGHFERSPMYHQILLLDLLELIELAQVSENNILTEYLIFWKSVACKGLCWLSNLQHPDGEISFFNDSAIGVAAKPSYIYDYAESLNLVFERAPTELLTSFRESGYTRINYDQHLVIFDHGKIGPDYLPGHAHADSLSFEWSVGQQRVIVNSGTSLYGLSKERLRQRQTPAHNTVVVDNADSSEVWSGFRVGRRAETALLKVQEFHGSEDSGKVVVSANHNGYLRLGSGVIHQRTINADRESLSIFDELSGKFISAYGVFHLHPEVKVERITETTLKLLLPNNTVVFVRATSGIDILDSTWHPYFGKSVANKKLRLKFTSVNIEMHFFISSYSE